MGKPTVFIMLITYRRTVQVKEFESITLEVTEESATFDKVTNLEHLVDTELEAHRERLRHRAMCDTSDSEGLGYEEA